MAQKVTFSPNREPRPIDATLEELGGAAILAGRSVRVRVQPDLYNYEKGSFSSWATLAWTLDLEDIEEGRRFREALTAFFKAFGECETAEKQRGLTVALLHTAKTIEAAGNSVRPEAPEDPVGDSF